MTIQETKTSITIYKKHYTQRQKAYYPLKQGKYIPLKIICYRKKIKFQETSADVLNSIQ
jgi:hypothetical protein